MNAVISTEVYTIGKGQIGGTYCDSFWVIDSEGKTGYQCFRYPFVEEIPQMLSDLARHRKQLRKELSELAKAEKLLKRAESNANFRTRNPKCSGI